MKLRSFGLLCIIGISLALPPLCRAEEKSVFVQSGHAAGGVMAIAYSPDGSRVVTGGADKDAILWDVARHHEIRRFTGSEGSIKAVAFSPSGDLIASGGDDMVVRLWDANAGRLLREFRGHTGGITSLAFSPDGRTIISAGGTIWGQGWGPDGKPRGQDHTTRIWDATSGQELRKLTEPGFLHDTQPVGMPCHNRTLTPTASMPPEKWWESDSDFIRAMALSPDGRLIATGTFKHIRIWDAARGLLLCELTAGRDGKSNRPEAVAFSPDGGRLASGQGPVVQIWNVDSGREINYFKAGTGPIRSLVFSPDGQMLVSGGGDHIVRVWDVTNGKEMRHEKSSESVRALAMSPDGKIIAWGDRSEVQFWDLSKKSDLQLADTRIDGNTLVRYSHDGTKLAVVSLSNEITLWNLQTGRKLLRLTGHTGDVNSVAFSDDGELLVSASRDSSVRIWDVSAGREVRRFNLPSEKFGSVAISPDGRTVVVGIADRLTYEEAYHVAELQRDIQLAPLEAKAGIMGPSTEQEKRRELQKLQDRRLGLQFNIILWDQYADKVSGRLEGHQFPVTGLSFSDYGETLTSISDDKTVRSWDVASQTERRHLEIKDTPFPVIAALSPNATVLATSTTNFHTANLWNLATGSRTVDIQTNDPGRASSPSAAGRLAYVKLDGIKALTISPDDKKLVTGHFDGTLHEWDLNTGKLVFQAVANSKWVVSATISPDGERIAATGSDGTVRFYDTKSGRLIGTLYDFKNGEWISILPDGRYAASPMGGVALRVLLGNSSSQTLPIEQFASQYYQPDFVASTIGRNTVADVVPNGDPSRKAINGARSRLYYLGIGVSRYLHLSAADNLQFGASDPIDLGAALKSRGEGQFESVEIMTLTDSQVTRSEVSRRATEFLKRAREQDLVIVFFAGHGVNTPQSGYYYLTTDADPERLAQTAIPWTSINSLIRDVRAPVLLLADTCKAGDVVGSADWQTRSSIEAGILARGVAQRKVLVFTSSDEKTVSWEDSSFDDPSHHGGHGAFTWALIEGLRGAASGTNGTVKIADLWTYVQRRVPELTAALAARHHLSPQRPTIAQSGASDDMLRLKIADYRK